MWKQLIDTAEGGHWGKAYQVVVERTREGLKTTPDEKITRNAIRAMFPKYTPIEWNIPVELEEVENFTNEELQAVEKRIKQRKSHGPDAIPPEVVRPWS